MTLMNKVALVTGANRGIGEALVREMLEAGVAKVYATARDPNKLPDFGDTRVVPLQLDITDDASVNGVVGAAKDVDILVNNSGTMAFGDVNNAFETFEADMRTNYFGTLRVLRAFLPHFIARKSGTIADLSSIVGLAAVKEMAGYSASKAALHSITQTLRGQLENDNITVIGIYPGPIETELAKEVPFPDKPTPQACAAEIVQGIGEGRTYIFPDPLAKQVEQLYATDMHKLEYVSLHLAP